VPDSASNPEAGVQPLTPPNVPDAIKAPTGEHVAGRFHVVAVETFACEPASVDAGADASLTDAGATDASLADAGASYSWRSILLDAKIEDWDTNAVIGQHTHTPAPTFTSNDGSSVVGKPVAQVPSPTGSGGPWLLITAVSHGGTGIFSNVTSLQRINTAGGAPPTAPCDATTDPTAHQTVNGSADFYYYTN
jgi:hypothetical protein